MMSIKTTVFAAAAALLLCAVPAAAQWEFNNSKLFTHSVHPEDYPANRWEHHDRNGDGISDYVVQYDRTGLRIQEAYDYSGNGFLDDFYYYDEGTLVMRELDSTGDEQIDIWIRLVAGYLIAEIRRDTTGDGVPDYIRNYE